MPGGNLDMYNAQILAVACPRCSRGPRERCKSPLGSYSGQMVAPHVARVKAAGFKRERGTGNLVPLTD